MIARMLSTLPQRVGRRQVAALMLGLATSAVTMALARAQGPTGASNAMFVYFGTYTGEKSQGIYRARLDLAAGTVSEPELAATVTSPSFLALDPARRHLYAANEMGKFGDKPTGAVSGFAIDRATGALTLLNQESSGGSGPAHVSVDRKGHTVLVANYGGGSVASLPIGPDGRLGPAASVIVHEGSSVHPKRQTKPYAHSINMDTVNTFAYAADLGVDRIFIYRLDPTSSKLTPATPAYATMTPGSGPRHLSFHPSGKYAYVINELALTVTVFSRDAKSGALTEVQTISTLPAGQAADPAFSTAEVVVHPSGKFLYGSNRGHDSLVVFAIDDKTGKLTLVQHVPTQGSTPRGFGIDPTGRYLLAGNQRSDSVVVFRIDATSGRLTPTGQTLKVGSPVSVVFVPVT
ncbi:6-phosphogluconolactonase [Luteitalea pratensis]|uniref:6-phosphogluconolactonase n=2 Tax=Luteitalea pratensis TaxID=1855912 RepID=A0A143PL59_LUTPR|nr:6-phosphogluconolactonase [Luteitalea pratensis]